MNGALQTNPVDAGVMTAFLRTGTQIDHGSSVLMIASVLLFAGSLLALPEIVLLALALLFGVVEKYFAWRVALDAELFALLAAAPAETAGFDAALAACLGRQPSGTPRSLQSRWKGGNRLLLRQVAFCALQLVIIALQVALLAGTE